MSQCRCESPALDGWNREQAAQGGLDTPRMLPLSQLLEMKSAHANMRGARGVGCGHRLGPWVGAGWIRVRIW